MATWCVNQYDRELISFAIKNGFYLMQYQYDKQEKKDVTRNWGCAQKIKEGDWLIIYNGNRAFAIGEAIRPSASHNTTQVSTVANTIANKAHLYTSGIVFYDDAEVFYENLSDVPPGKKEPWGQRIDVKEWLYFTGLDNAVSTEGIASNMLPGYITTNTVFGINEDFFNKIKDKLVEKSQKLIEENIVRYTMSETGKLEALTEYFNNIIFQGPPGTSKTFQAKMLAAAITLGIEDEDKLNKMISNEKDATSDFRKTAFPNKANFGYGTWAIVQFHPSYNYEDFVRGIQVTTAGSNPKYDTVNRILIDMAEEARKEDGKNEKRKFVLIIDEINRAHLAAVLGELIYALEYRGCPINTPYEIEDENTKEKCRSITIPDNLYIIGTMNTADRSVGHIDYAVRRRFAFVPLLPNVEVIKKYGFPDGEKLFNEVATLFYKDGEKSKSSASTLSPEFYPDDVQPGHTYFMKEKPEELAKLFAYQVFPLLREYYKDGILTKNSKLFSGEIIIEHPHQPEEIEKAVIKFLGQ